LQRPICFAAKPTARLIDQQAHEMLEDHRTTGEWFDVGLDDAAAVVSGLAQTLTPT
jgi:hypothetical protein